ncbi:MAG: hypothetical protein ACOY3O_12470 [Thermodesulfobacteriota bacterium]
MQLDLFQWEALAASSGYHCLAALDFDGARDHFTRILRGIPDHAEASRGLRDLEFWQEVFRELDRRDPKEQPLFLWERITAFRFRNVASHRNMRRALIGRLLPMLAGDHFYHPPDLCRGYLLLELGNFGAAADEFRLLLAHLPENGHLHGYLAKALWLLGKEEEAKTACTIALLLDPAAVNTAALPSPPLLELIHEHGPALAPVYGYLAGLLPLIEPPSQANSPEAQAYSCLRQAELARLRDDHPAMVEARRELKRLAPAVLKNYLAWLAAKVG